MTTDSQRPRLRELRTELGWTQQELADRLLHLAWTKGDKHAGINADMVAKWELRGDGPGVSVTTRAARLLLQVLHDREADVLRFAHDLKVPTSNQAERDLRPSKVQQNISRRLTSENHTRDRYKIRGYASTAAKHGLNILTAPTRRRKPPNRHATPPHRTFAYSG